jgi:translation initiation factor 2 beta subunit (eIF-2beta)/eIF-5
MDVLQYLKKKKNVSFLFSREREKKAAQQSTTDGKKDASDNKSSAGGEFGDKRRKEEGSGKKPPPKTMNAGGDVKGARPPSTAAPTRSPTLTHRQHMAHLHRQREIRENYEKRGKGSERFAFSPVPVREKETPPSIKNRADVVLRLEQDPSAPKRYRQLPNPSAWSYLTRILEESKLHKEASLLLSRQMMPNMIPDSLLNPHKHKRDKAQEEDREKTREESGSQHPATQQGQGQSSCGQNPRPATEEPSKSSENQPKKEPEIRYQIRTVRLSNFDRRDPKMGVFLQSADATPADIFLNESLPPKIPLWTPCSWLPWPWFSREKSLIFKVS